MCPHKSTVTLPEKITAVLQGTSRCDKRRQCHVWRDEDSHRVGGQRLPEPRNKKKPCSVFGDLRDVMILSYGT